MESHSEVMEDLDKEKGKRKGQFEIVLLDKEDRAALLLGLY